MSREICKYFLTNSCRYGDSCRNVHDYSAKNPYVLVNYPPKNAQLKFNNKPQKSDAADPAFINESLSQLSQDTKQVESHGIWPLSCFGFCSFGNIPGWEDLSPEELRWKAYQATATGTFHNYIKDAEAYLRKASEARAVFIKPDKLAASLIKNIVKEGKPTDTNVPPLFPSTTKPSTTVASASSSSFTFSLQGNPAFNQVRPSSSNVFGLKNDPAPGLFGRPIQSTKLETNIFGQPTTGTSSSTPMFNQPVFNHPHPQPFEIDQQPPALQSNAAKTFSFAQALPFPQAQNFHNQQTIFGNDINKTENFNRNVFGNVATPQSVTSTHVSSFGRENMSQSQSTGDSKIYSKISDLTEEEIDQFKAPTFTYRKVPIKPPPKELCR